MNPNIEQFDQKVIRCRKLGHEVPFAYCRQENGEMPCSKSLDCWFEMFDVRAFVQTHYDAAQIKNLITPAPPKMTQLWQIMQQALSEQNA